MSPCSAISILISGGGCRYNIVEEIAAHYEARAEEVADSGGDSAHYDKKCV